MYYIWKHHDRTDFSLQVNQQENKNKVYFSENILFEANSLIMIKEVGVVEWIYTTV